MRKTYFELKIKSENEKTQYCCLVNKYDRHGYKVRPRVLIITNLKFYLLDDKKLTAKETISLRSITAILTSNRNDGLFIVKWPIEKKEKVMLSSVKITLIIFIIIYSFVRFRVI